MKRIMDSWIIPLGAVALLWVGVAIINISDLSPEPDDFAKWKHELYEDRLQRVERLLVDNTFILNGYERERDMYRPVTDPIHFLRCDKCHKENN